VIDYNSVFPAPVQSFAYITNGTILNAPKLEVFDPVEALRSAHSPAQLYNPSLGAESSDGTVIWPPNSGFEEVPTKETLSVGKIVDRYGNETGKFVSPQGTPYASRSLPPGSDTRPYYVYEVVQEIEVLSGKAAPWFNSPGGGTQYQFTQSVESLVQSGYLRRLS
jgi:hypothetical protein